LIYVICNHSRTFCIVSSAEAKAVAPAPAFPPIDHILNIFELEQIASQKMDKQGWDYYSSGADDEITLRENHSAFQRIWLRPRVLVDVSKIDTTTSFLGTKVTNNSLDVFFFVIKICA
jgi:hypothetical protein